MINPANGLAFYNNIKMFFNITSYITVVYVSIVRKQIYNFTHAISTTFMIKVKNTVLSTHVAPRTLQFMLVPYFDFVGFKSIMFRGVAVTIEKFSFFHVRESKMLPNVPGSVLGSVFATNPQGNVFIILGSSSAANTPPKIFFVNVSRSRARLI